MGYQKGYINNIYDIFTRVVLVLSIALAAKHGAGVATLIAIVLFIPASIAALNLSTIFALQMPWLRPTFSSVNFTTIRSILQQGFLFVVLQLVTAAAFASDNVVVAKLFGPGAVTSYTLPRTFFQMVATATLLLLMPLWPAYGEAIARGDLRWVKRTLTRSLILTALLASAGAIAVAALTKPALHAWVGHSANPSFALLSGFGTFVVLTTCGNVLAMLLNAASVIRFQVITSLAMGVAAFIAKVYLGRYFGLEGVIWGTNAAYVVFSLLPTAIFLKSKRMGDLLLLRTELAGSIG